MNKNIFIFVVCGAREHIDTLHFSLDYLKKYSKNEIWILTDSTRNEIPIIHDKIVDIVTPSDFDHHQASIFLKTGIHHYFPKGNNYCYLDTDIIAMSPAVDEIFNQFQSPISFAPDHCTMEQFSAYAVNCDCQDLYNHYNEKLNNHLSEIDPLRNTDNQKLIENRKQLVSYYQKHDSFLSKLFLSIRFVLNRKRFEIDHGLYFERINKVWKNKDGEIFMNYFKWPKASKTVGLKWNFFKGYPQLPDGRNLWKMECAHLIDYIQSDFDIKIDNYHFQHWNGGVFLFNDSSHDFLETWFQSTMEIFKNPDWKTRDQGTLIKTIWEKGLENHPTLSKEWNLIADYHNPHLRWENNQVYLSPTESYTPAFIHVYHHFGDETWAFWNEIFEQQEEI